MKEFFKKVKLKRKEVSGKPYGRGKEMKKKKASRIENNFFFPFFPFPLCCGSCGLSLKAYF